MLESEGTLLALPNLQVNRAGGAKSKESLGIVI